MTIPDIMFAINKIVFYKYPIIPLEFAASVHDWAREDLNSEGARCYKGKGYKNRFRKQPTEAKHSYRSSSISRYFARSCSIGYWQFSRDILLCNTTQT